VKILIAEDDSTSRLLLQELLKSYGPVHTAVNGREAVAAVRLALKDGEPYDLICLDIMMPKMDGQEALAAIRRIETADGVAGSNRTKIVMTTALADRENVMEAVAGKCDDYLIKPIQKAKLLEALHRLALIA
jgi:two-component system chemotaxis response regulator CheY